MREKKDRNGGIKTIQIRKGETMSYAMPSNSGKSRFTIDIATYIAYKHKKKVLIVSNEMSEEKMKLTDQKRKNFRIYRLLII